MSTETTVWKENMLKAAGMWPGMRPFCDICRYQSKPFDSKECLKGVDAKDIFPCTRMVPRQAADERAEGCAARIAAAFYAAGHDDGVSDAEENAASEPYRAEPIRNEGYD